MMSWTSMFKKATFREVLLPSYGWWWENCLLKRSLDVINLLCYKHWKDKQKYFYVYRCLVVTCQFGVGLTYILYQYILIRSLSDVIYCTSLIFRLGDGLEFRLSISYELKDYRQSAREYFTYLFAINTVELM